MNETSNVQNAPAVEAKRVVKARHPWLQMWDNKNKLKAARAIAARRRELKWHKERDELSRLLDAAEQRKLYRKKLGLPLEYPKAKPHELKRAKRTNRQLTQPDLSKPSRPIRGQAS